MKINDRMMLAARINDLRCMGYSIKTQKQKTIMAFKRATQWQT